MGRIGYTTPEWRGMKQLSQKEGLYTEREYSLENYLKNENAPQSKYLPKPDGESPTAYVQRMKGLMSLSHIDLNRVGSVWVHRRDQTDWVWRGCWWELAASDDLGPLLDRLCAHTGLPASEHLPKPTRAVVAYRVIAAFLTHQILSPRQWTCRNGYLDSSDEGGRRDELFEHFPEARERRRHADISDLFGQPAYRFWFLLKDDQPALAIEPAAGLAWDTGGRRIDLYARYQRTHSIWSAVWSAAGPLLP